MLPFRGEKLRMSQNEEATVVYILLSGFAFRSP